MPRLQTHFRSRCSVLAVALFAAVSGVHAQSLIHVPSDASDLQTALARIDDGGTIELASGTYSAPAGAYVNPAGKAFTIAAAPAALVIVSGSGARDVLRLTNGSRPAGKLMTFIGITFSDGVTAQNFIGGAATIGSAEVIFKNCSFINNQARGNSTAGGAFFVNNSVVSFTGCLFKGNLDRNGGGAISALDSTVYISGCRFVGNRADGPAHSPSSPGGAIYSYHCMIQVASSVFEDNHAGYVGGAIYGAAAWSSSEESVEIKNSVFYGNGALRDASVSFGAPAVGGAVHVEENSTLRVSDCNFTANVSTQAGAISTYRAIADIDHCIFNGNKALPVGTSGEGVGGAILALSGDSAADGANRRSITLNVTDCLFNGTTDGSPNAKQGGQIFVGGDPNAAYGLNGVPQNGTPESNRAQLRLQRVTFYQSRVDSSNEVPARGSAVLGDFAHIEADEVMFLKGDAGSGSGALEAVNDCVLHVINSVFQQNSATAFSAGITHFGGELNVTNTRFVNNFYKPQNSGRGVDIVTSPNGGGSGGAGTDMTGLISHCLFTGAGDGGRVYDGAGMLRPYNLLQYSENDFMPDANAFVSDILRVTSVAGLNNFVATFASGFSIRKAPAANVALTALPNAANLLSYTVIAPVPGGTTTETSSSRFVAFAANNACTVDGVRQETAGVLSVSGGAHVLAVGDQTYTTTVEKNTPVNVSTRLQVGSGSEVLIGGFIVQGTTPKKVAVRGIGPSLTRAGLTGVLVDPNIKLYDQRGGLVAFNDDWQTSDLRMEIAGVGLEPSDPKESALTATLSPGSYTVVLAGANDATGIGLVEIYDLDGGRVTKVANISTRGVVAGGDRVMIGGFILQGENGPTNVVVRGIGPSLAKAGVGGALDDGVLELYNSQGQMIGQNDDWNDGADAAFISRNSLQPTDDKESALLLRNAGNGNYTAILRGKNGASGVCLVEAYVF